MPRGTSFPQKGVIQNFIYHLKHKKQIKNLAEFLRRFCVRAAQSSVKLLKANEGECKCFIPKTLKFTPKITDIRVSQYQDIIFTKWKSLAQFLLLTLYSPVAFWLFYFLLFLAR